MPPAFVLHADWSVDPAKRWVAVARRRGERWEADAPRPVDLGGGPVAGLVDTREFRVGILIGVDAVIGLPRAYARAVGVERFRDLLPQLGAGRWSRFFDVADAPHEVSPTRPFYPDAPGGAEKAHLTTALGLDAPALLRRCERPTVHRSGASELFWTIGGKQVGKATIALWREVLQPLLAADRTVHLWPFDGSLEELTAGPGVTFVEAYPAEARLQLGLGRPRGSKRDHDVRAADAGDLLAWAGRAGVDLTDGLRAGIRDGFGDDAYGEDRYDAVIGLFGMLEVVAGRRSEGAPRDDPAVTAVEGWILGLDPADLTDPAP